MCGVDRPGYYSPVSFTRTIATALSPVRRELPVYDCAFASVDLRLGQAGCQLGLCPVCHGAGAWDM